MMVDNGLVAIRLSLTVVPMLCRFAVPYVLQIKVVTQVSAGRASLDFVVSYLHVDAAHAVMIKL